MSHSWGKNSETHLSVIEMANKLAQDGFRVWIDDKNLNESVAEDIVLGIDRSAAFVAFLTKDYMKKTSIRDSNAGKEFNYITRRGAKYVIPVVLDRELLDPSSWQGTVAALHLGNSLYIDFTTKERVTENWPHFCERVKSICKFERKLNIFS